MTILEFAKRVTNIDVKDKAEILKKLQTSFDSNIDYDGKPLLPNHKIDMEILIRWLTVNIMVGEELCPADDILNYKITSYE